MDKKNLILGLLFLALSFGIMAWGTRQQQKSMDEWRQQQAEQAARAPAPETQPSTAPATPTAQASAPAPLFPSATPPEAAPQTATALSAAASTVPATTYSLENDVLTVTFTTRGGAIQTVELKNFDAAVGTSENVMLNEGAPSPALSLALPNPSVTGGLPPVPVLPDFELVPGSLTGNSVVFRHASPEGVEITRSYAILESSPEKNAEPYVIVHETRIANRGAAPIDLRSVYFNAGLAPPTPDSGPTAGAYLNFGYYDGASAHFVSVTEFKDSAPFMGLFGGHKKVPYVAGTLDGAPTLQWVSVKNDFFAAVLTPQTVTTTAQAPGAASEPQPLRGDGYYVAGVPLTLNGKPEVGVTGDMQLDLGVLAPGATVSAVFHYYAGPKEYIRLDRLGQEQDRVMEFGFFGWLSQLLLLGLIALHKAIVHLSPEWAWGWSIVAITILIKLVLWPLTAVQVKSSKRMAQLQAPMAELREKYKDQPEKLQKEMLELWKKHKVNPAAGCWPILIQLPIFIAFYQMLRTSSELRHASFFWIHDLAAPDTIGHLMGFSINPLPLVMTLTMVVQMRLTPSPTTDNAQRLMLQWMPFIFLFFFYTMPSGMILYWTCQNLFTIAQQLITNRMKDAPETGASPGPAPGKNTPAPKPAAKPGKA